MLSVKLLSRRGRWLTGTVSQHVLETGKVSDVWSARGRPYLSAFSVGLYSVSPDDTWEIRRVEPHRRRENCPERTWEQAGETCSSSLEDSESCLTKDPQLSFENKSSAQDSLLPHHTLPSLHTNTHWHPTSSAHKYLTSFSPPLVFLPPRQSTSRLPAPLRCGCTPLWQKHSSRAPSRPAVLPEHPGCQRRSRAWTEPYCARCSGGNEAAFTCIDHVCGGFLARFPGWRARRPGGAPSPARRWWTTTADGHSPSKHEQSTGPVGKDPIQDVLDATAVAKRQCSKQSFTFLREHPSSEVCTTMWPSMPTWSSEIWAGTELSPGGRSDLRNCPRLIVCTITVPSWHTDNSKTT